MIGNKLPRYTYTIIVNQISIPLLPNLVSQFLINQYSLDVDFGEHGRTVTVVWDSDQPRNSADCSDMRLEDNHQGQGLALLTSSPL